MINNNMTNTNQILGGVSDRKKKKSIKGVLDKADLAEVYNVKKSKNKGVVPCDFTIPVNAVEFKEAVLEHILPNISDLAKSDSPVQRRKSGGHNFFEAVRRVSQVQMNNNNNNYHDPKFSHTIHRANSEDHSSANGVTDSNPSGYEPENSLRRVSAITRPLGFKREGAMRRKSALDRPTSLPVHNCVAEPIKEATTSTENVNAANYEPENSLRRVRKVSDQSGQGRSAGRQRRTGALVQPTLSKPEINTKPSPDIARKERPDVNPRITYHSASDSSIQTCLSTDSGCHSSDSSPTTPRATAFKQPLFSLSIPEDEALSSEGSTTAPSPRPLRKISKVKMPLKLDRTTPALFRSKSRDSMSAASKMRRASLGTPSPITSEAMLSPQEGTITPRSAIKKAEIRAQASHINQTRYWDWYLLNASYTWKNFNNHKTYCY